MAKMFNYMAITIGIWIFLTILGVSLSGSFIQDKLGMGTPEGLANIQSSVIWLYILAGFTGLAVGSIIIGYFTKTISAIPATATLAGTAFGFFIMDIVLLLNEIPTTWVKNILFIFVAIYTAGFIITLWDWARGID